jgi:t-SNARE complex subunit (syntaxin)
MARARTTNFSMYAHEALTEGQIIKRDFKEIKALTRELANLAHNINQIALRANETRNIYEKDIVDQQRMYGEVKSKVSERLVKMIRG